MKKLIFLIIFVAIICFIAGCGPGQPFEIENHHQMPIKAFSAR